MLAIERGRSAIRREVGNHSQIVGLLDVVRAQEGEASLDMKEAEEIIRFS